MNGGASFDRPESADDTSDPGPSPADQPAHGVEPATPMPASQDTPPPPPPPPMTTPPWPTVPPPPRSPMTPPSTDALPPPSWPATTPSTDTPPPWSTTMPPPPRSPITTPYADAPRSSPPWPVPSPDASLAWPAAIPVSGPIAMPPRATKARRRRRGLVLTGVVIVAATLATLLVILVASGSGDKLPGVAGPVAQAARDAAQARADLDDAAADLWLTPSVHYTGHVTTSALGPTTVDAEVTAEGSTL